MHIGNLEEFIRAGRIESAIRTLNLDERLIKDVADEVALAYQVQGRNLVKSLKPPRDIAKARWRKLRDPMNRQIAEQYARDESSRLIVEIVNPQRQLARSVIEHGLRNQVHPSAVALELVGRWNRKTKRREGGFIGLTTNQGQWVQNVQTELTSGTTGDLNHYLNRKLRDKRFDRTVRKAIREGKPIPKAKVDSMVRHYKAKALKYRGDAIARTESLSAMNLGRQKAMDLLVQNGGIKSKDNMQKEWVSTHDSRVRDSHLEIDGQQRGVDEAFDVNGYSAMQPGDDSLPAKEKINCRCRTIPITDWDAERELGLE